MLHPVWIYGASRSTRSLCSHCVLALMLSRHDRKCSCRWIFFWMVLLCYSFESKQAEFPLLLHQHWLAFNSVCAFGSLWQPILPSFSHAMMGEPVSGLWVMGIVFTTEGEILYVCTWQRARRCVGRRRFVRRVLFSPVAVWQMVNTFQPRDCMCSALCFCLNLRHSLSIWIFFKPVQIV